MAADILNPTYFISELVGNVTVFAVLLLLGVVYLSAKQKLPFQWVVVMLGTSFLMLPLIFSGFLAWVPIILVVGGIIVASIFYRFIERT